MQASCRFGAGMGGPGRVWGKEREGLGSSWEDPGGILGSVLGALGASWMGLGVVSESSRGGQWRAVQMAAQASPTTGQDEPTGPYDCAKTVRPSARWKNGLRAQCGRLRPAPARGVKTVEVTIPSWANTPKGRRHGKFASLSSMPGSCKCSFNHSRHGLQQGSTCGSPHKGRMLA